MSDAPTVNSVQSPTRTNTARAETMRVHTAEPSRLTLSASFVFELEKVSTDERPALSDLRIQGGLS